MSKKPADDFFNSVDYPGIIDTIKGVFTSDGSISTLIYFERVLDEADLYAYKNWELGELVDGPEIGKYSVTCTFMYPHKLMPNPKGGKRLTGVGCTVHYKKTKIKVPIEIKNPMDFRKGTHYPKMAEREVWLVRIAMPKQLMNEIREGSIDLADQTIDLQDLDDAYEQDLDKESQQDESAASGGDITPMAPQQGAMPPQGAPV